MHQVYTVKKVIRETPKAVSILLDGKISYSPGQFIMIWLPGLDEKPFAVSYQEKSSFGITIEEKGRFTKAISKIEEGTKVGIRGPYGNGFKVKDNSIIVAGGLGMAPALPLIKEIKDSVIIQGARSKEFLLYLNNKALMKTIEKNNNRIIRCTDDGSFGIHGFTTEILKDEISKKAGTVYTCGPEMMIKKVFGICEESKAECQASLERFIKCGIGLCGSCCINSRLVCRDGPVFSSSQLRELEELGKFARLKSGRKVSVKEYYNHRSK
ncbi:dihydroorotate dehydrogenase electron transfer subunit [Candidatus Woesearchaeota archaeon]|nr:dihydroorotate dehydrogenase electron transfer subunit [Candidatus Woesearchaeota archaeon]